MLILENKDVYDCPTVDGVRSSVEVKVQLSLLSMIMSDI